MRISSLLVTALAALTLGGCISPVSYGDIRHGEYVADPRCDPQPGNPTSINGSQLLFFVTSRLPDCRLNDITLLHHRSDRLRYGRFAEPRMVFRAGKEKLHTDIGFEHETDWWTDLEAETNRRKGRVLLYVHGYRENFDSTSADTAQIARMTNFDGPVVSYTWPSQGKLLSYITDETNMYHDVANFRVFLRKLAERPWVKEIIIVSHSLGGRLVIPAIAHVDANAASADSSNISNIILASPDMDRETFERDIASDVLAPRRVAMDRRITVYVSGHDRALAASRTLHGYPRLGSPYCFNPFQAEELAAKGLPERCYVQSAKGLTVVDTSDVKRGSTGHSDFLSSAEACLDFIDVVAGVRTRPKRIPSAQDNVFLLAQPEKLDSDQHRAICSRKKGSGEE
jgi:esterase/lipase superfamily enzyme